MVAAVAALVTGVSATSVAGGVVALEEKKRARDACFTAGVCDTSLLRARRQVCLSADDPLSTPLSGFLEVASEAWLQSVLAPSRCAGIMAPRHVSVSNNVGGDAIALNAAIGGHQEEPSHPVGNTSPH